MASKKHKSSALDPLLAGFAAGATAFVLYAMPAWRFEQAVAMTGLAAILPAAEPPLGTTARLAAMTVAAIGAFLLVWLTLHALGKPAPKKRRPVAAAVEGPKEIPVELPKLRRADAHPDAPARRPILAGLDLGRPLDEVDLDAPEEKPAEPAPEAAENIEPSVPEYGGETDKDIEFGEPADEEPVADEPESLEDSREEAFSEAPEVQKVQDVQDEEREPELVAAVPVEQRAESPAPRESDPSIAELMQRFEAGLRRREAAHWGTAAPAPAPADPLNTRLQGAIAELQKLARRGNKK